jgi:branched-chain amino acid transport system ATP-binding protein
VGRKPSQIVADGLVHCPEGRKLFPGMSVLKNLTLGAYVHRRDSKGTQKSLEEVFELFPILNEKRTCRPARCPAASSRWWRSAAR